MRFRDSVSSFWIDTISCSSCAFNAYQNWLSINNLIALWIANYFVNSPFSSLSNYTLRHWFGELDSLKHFFFTKFTKQMFGKAMVSLTKILKIGNANVYKIVTIIKDVCVWKCNNNKNVYKEVHFLCFDHQDLKKKDQINF